MLCISIRKSSCEISKSGFKNYNSCDWIGAGSEVDGQVLVSHDMIGMTHEFNPRFLRRYLNLFDDISNAVKKYVNDVKTKNFPNNSEQY